MKPKRIFELALSAIMSISLCACGNGDSSAARSSETISSANSSEVSVANASEISAENSSEISNENSAAVSSAETTSNNSPKESEIGDVSAKELVSQMKMGWNLGNTLDATGGSGISAETSWGNPKTTKATIDAVKDAGFNVLRVPVSWGTHLDENYNIDSAWMNRVQEVVDYGIDNDMFVILNTHHEEWYMPKAENLEHDLAELEAVWKQIAERFEGYGEKLIFEGLNEPRLRGDSLEWSGDESSREIVNQYAETFVKTVRATGGNNQNRILMVTPYAASCDENNLKALKIPEDSGKIIVSVHAYIPNSFALEKNGTAEFNAEKSNTIPKMFESIKRVFLDKDIPVIIGEFGSVNKENLEQRITWANSYVSLAKQNGVPCIWWDNGQKSGDGENFGLINRSDNTWYFPQLVETIKQNAY